MTTTQQQMPCPDCNAPIYFVSRDLALGKKFQCSKCSLVVGIAEDSLETVKNAIKELDELTESMNLNQDAE